MSFQVGLNIATLVMCLITMAMASAALMPQMKRGLIILRDGLLWGLAVGTVGLVAFVGWMRLHEARQRRAQPESGMTLVQPSIELGLVSPNAGGSSSPQPVNLSPYGGSHSFASQSASSTPPTWPASYDAAQPQLQAGYQYRR